MERKPLSPLSRFLLAVAGFAALCYGAYLIGPRHPVASDPFVGIGVKMDYGVKPPVISRVMGGSPADVDGLMAGDKVLAIGNTPTEGQTPEQLQSLMQGGGLPGSKVWLVVERAGAPEAFGLFVTRQKIRIGLVPADIGIVFGGDNGCFNLVIRDVMPGSAADKAGLKAGDVIVAIDGQDTVVYPVDRAAEMMRGQKGTSVEFAVLRVGPGARPQDLVKLDRKTDSLKFTVVRDPIYMEFIEILDTGVSEPEK